MSGQLLTPFEHGADAGATAVEIGRGNHGTVHLDRDTMVVSKRLTIGDRERVASLVRREFAHLERLSAIFRSRPYLGCPEPVAVDAEHGIVRMTYCPGVRLDHALADGNADVLDSIDHIAAQIALGVTLYVAEFDEPCFSLSTNNMMFDPATSILYLIDFSSSRVIPGVDPDEANLDVTLGCFLGVTTYHTVRVRPATWARRDYWVRQRRFSEAVVRNLGATHEINRDLIRHVADETYKTLAVNGRPLRRLWYSTAGRLLFDRRLAAILDEVTD